MEKYILAIDQGTTSTRAIIFNHEQKAIAIAQKEFTQYYPHSGWVEQDANEIWLTTLAVLSQVMQKANISPSAIEAIGITNQRETTIMWDKTTGMPIYNAIVWQSCQSEQICQRLKTKENERIIKEKTGLIIDPYFSATKIKWIYENVKEAKNNKNLLFGTVDTWLVWKLTNGKIHITDVTNASRTLLFNIHTQKWDKELLDIFDIDPSILPEVKDSSEIYGECEPYHFFNHTVKIASVIGDQQSALFGQSCFSEGSIKNTYGTGGFMLMNTGDKIIESKHGLLSTIAWRINNETKYCLEGSILVSGSLIQWLRDNLKLFKDSNETYDIAKQVDDTNGVIIVPAFVGMGAPYWNKNCRGMILGLTRGTSANHIVRAALEAMCYQSKDLLDAMEKDTGLTISNMQVDGGASKNEFLLQFQSDILQTDVESLNVSETTALGAARMAGLAVGYWTMDDFKKETKKIYSPKISKAEAERLYSKWLKAVETCLTFTQEG
ncbi:MAG: glycerol kinase GlpK [Erysipelotrichaceae bacterium]|nr:glycerol kinase GlpK [Erysipelotrichaceae bacterium]